MLTKRRTTCTSNTLSQHDFAHLLFSGYIIRNIKMWFYYSNSTNRLQVTDFIKLYFSNFAAVIRCSTNTLLCHTTTQIHSSLKRIYCCCFVFIPAFWSLSRGFPAFQLSLVMATDITDGYNPWIFWNPSSVVNFFGKMEKRRCFANRNKIIYHILFSFKMEIRPQEKYS